MGSWAITRELGARVDLVDLVDGVDGVDLVDGVDPPSLLNREAPFSERG